MSAQAEPATFAFTPEYRARADKIIARYPKGRQQSALLPLLDLAQRQAGWIPRAAIEHIAEILEIAPIRVEEVVSFYTMFHGKPVGKHVVWLCTTTPCWLCGSDDIVARCKQVLGIEIGETTPDGMFTLMEAECLGACVNAPMIQIDDDYFEDLTPDSVQAVLEAYKRGETPKPGPQSGRFTSEPAGGATTLKSRPATR
ncbi:MAG: NADH-quinone oxidoreductase subunit NuoE [Alphaproteobacteria bacterium]